MGGSSSHEYGKIHIFPDKETYKAGDTITGNVYVKMEKAIPKGGVLVLKFKGWEKTKWSENLSSYNGVNVFYRNRVDLYQWPHGSNIELDSFKFPFSLKTDPNIPGTFFFKNDDGVYAEILYKIKAEINPHNNGIPKMKNTTKVVIRENYDNYKEDLYKEVSLPCVTCYCMSQGTTKLGCQFEQITYIAGDTADLIVGVDNSSCSLVVDAIEAKFVQVMSFKCNGGEVRNIQKTLLKKDFGSVMPYASKIGKNANKIALKLAAEKPFEPSTSGDIISCKYDLIVKCQMLGTCLEAEPKVTSNVFLYPTALSDYGQVQAPPGFNPRPMPAYIFVLSPETQYANRDGSQIVLRTRIPGQAWVPQPQQMMNVNPNQVVPTNMNTQRPPENMPLLQTSMMQQQQPPMMQQQQPPMMQQQPPMMQQQQPPMMQQQQPPMMQQQQPIMMQQQQPPMMQQQQPIMMQQSPMMQQQQPPIMQQQQPIMMQQSPMMQQQQPPMMQQQSPMYNQQPQGFNQQPQGFNQQPQGFNQQPQGFNQQPQGFNQQPMSPLQQQPIYNNQQQFIPKAQQPIYNQQQPGVVMQQTQPVYQPMNNPVYIPQQPQANQVYSTLPQQNFPGGY